MRARSHTVKVARAEMRVLWGHNNVHSQLTSCADSKTFRMYIYTCTCMYNILVVLHLHECASSFFMQCSEAVANGVDIINFSYGEASHWTNKGYVSFSDYAKYIHTLILKLL